MQRASWSGAGSAGWPGLIVACDALVAWCSALLDEGYRGEMECIIAKIFGSEAQKEAAIELFMKTHGGRSFLHGHLFGDNVHEYLAPCIYEGEGEMLGMAFFKSLVKQHGTQFFEPIGKALAAAGHQEAEPAQPAHAWALRGAIGPYAKWLVGEKLARKSRRRRCPRCPRPCEAHAEFAGRLLAAVAAGDQRRDAQAPARAGRPPVPDVGAFGAASRRCGHSLHGLYAARQDDEVVRDAADLFCQDLHAEADRPAAERPLLPDR